MSNSGGLKARVFAGDRPRKIAMMSGCWPTANIVISKAVPEDET